MPATTLHTNGIHSSPVIVLENGTHIPAEPAYRVIRRNRAVTPFDATKITVALTKAFLAVEGSTAANSRRVHDVVSGLTEQVVAGLTKRADAGRTFHIEEVQDQVELALMRGGHHRVARAYVLYREERTGGAWPKVVLRRHQPQHFTSASMTGRSRRSTKAG